MSTPICVIVGVGEGNGAALARAFSKAGMAVALLARQSEFPTRLATTLPNARAYACDVSNVTSVAETFARIRSELGSPTTVVYNAGSGVWGDVERISLEAFEAAWRVNACGALAVSREVIPAMKAGGGGNIILIGATASRRGGIAAHPRVAGLQLGYSDLFGSFGIERHDARVRGELSVTQSDERNGSLPAPAPRMKLANGVPLRFSGQFRDIRPQWRL